MQRRDERDGVKVCDSAVRGRAVRGRAVVGTYGLVCLEVQGVLRRLCGRERGGAEWGGTEGQVVASGKARLAASHGKSREPVNAPSSPSRISPAPRAFPLQKVSV